LIDSSGNVIGDYIINLTASNFGVLNSWSIANGGTNLSEDLLGNDTNATVGLGSFAGTSFQIADFTGTTGDLSLATGIKLSGAGGALDPSLVGLAAIPEPAAAGLLLGAFGLGLAFCRRQTR
jgi:hypothetical protein